MPAVLRKILQKLSGKYFISWTGIVTGMVYIENTTYGVYGF